MRTASVNKTVDSAAGRVQTTNGTAVDFSGCISVAMQSVVTVNAPSNPTFVAANVNTATDTITITAHGFATGQVCTLTNSGGALPAGLAGATSYYIIVLTANTFQLASSLALATAGTPVDITGAGTGTQTVVLTALAGASLQLQKSLDGTNYYNDGSAQTVSASGAFLFENSAPCVPYFRLRFIMTSGSVTVTSSAYGVSNS